MLVCLMAAAVPVFWLLFPWSILLEIFAWAIVPIVSGVVFIVLKLCSLIGRLCFFIRKLYS